MIIEPKRISKYYQAYSNLNIVLFILINIALMVITNIAISKTPFTEDLINPIANDLLDNNNIVYAFFMMIILIPFFETIIFQALIIKLSYHIFKQYDRAKKGITIFISSFLFAINHSYNITYMVTTFFIGIILAVSYMVIIKRKYSAIIIIFLIHALYNMIPFISHILTQ